MNYKYVLPIIFMCIFSCTATNAQASDINNFLGKYLKEIYKALGMDASRLGKELKALQKALSGSGNSQAKPLDFQLDYTDPLVPNSNLGLSFPGSNPKFYDLVSVGGIGVVRLSVSWGLVEPEKGNFKWSGLDSRILKLQELGIQPFLTFESNAEWAVTPESFSSVKNATPKDYDDWKDFIGKVVERYNYNGVNDAAGLKAPVPYYQVANEWISPTNKSGGWTGTPQQLIEYVNIAHSEVKRLSPNTKFVMGGIASGNLDILVNVAGIARYKVQQVTNDGGMRDFEEEINAPETRTLMNEFIIPVLKQSRYDYMDLHLYGPENRDFYRINAIRKVIGNTPLLSAECGGPTLDYGDLKYRPEDHFFAVIERNLNLLSAGMPFCLWFRLGEGEGGTPGNKKTALFDLEQNVKPGFMAYKLLNLLLKDTTNIKQQTVIGKKVYTLTQRNAPTITVMWRADRKPLTANDLRGYASQDIMLVSQGSDRRQLNIQSAQNATGSRPYLAIYSPKAK